MQRTKGLPRMKSKLILTTLTALVALTAFAGSAQAACSTAGAKQAFSQWGDQRNYVLAPDGGFEAGAQGWDLDGAKAVAGNESYYLNAASDDTSLSLPAGSSAGSPPICMDIGTP